MRTWVFLACVVSAAATSAPTQAPTAAPTFGGRSEIAYILGISMLIGSLVFATMTIVFIRLVKRLRMDYSARCVEAMCWFCLFNALTLLMAPETHQGDTILTNDFWCQIQGTTNVVTRTFTYGVILALLHTEFMVLFHNIYPWSNLWNHFIAILVVVAVMGFLPYTAGGYRPQYYGKCGVNSATLVGRIMIYVAGGGQFIIMIIVFFGLRRIRLFMARSSLMVAKPVQGSFYGAGLVKEKMKYHWPYYKIGVVGLLTSLIAVLSEVGYEVANMTDSAIKVMDKMLFPLHSCADFLLTGAAVLIFVFPERKWVWEKLHCHRFRMKVVDDQISWDPAISSDRVDQATQHEEKFQNEMEAVRLLLRGTPEEHVTNRVDAFAAMAEVEDEEEPNAALSPRSPPDAQALADGALLVNPVFGQQTGRERSMSELPLGTEGTDAQYGADADSRERSPSALEMEDSELLSPASS